MAETVWGSPPPPAPRRRGPRTSSSSFSSLAAASMLMSAPAMKPSDLAEMRTTDLTFSLAWIVSSTF